MLGTLAACSSTLEEPASPTRGDTRATTPALTVAATLSQARAADGQYIAWVEHRIDDEGINGGIAIRGGDGLKLADLDGDGLRDVVSVHEDSHHLRIAYGTTDPDRWETVTVARGKVVGAIEDVAVGDLNGDGRPDLVAACEAAHLAYFQNPGTRSGGWPSLVPAITRNRGSWLQVDLADVTGDGRLEVLGANKGFADIVRLAEGQRVDNATALFTIDGNPLDDAAWREQVLMQDGIPNQALVVDVDADGDPDLLAASRNDYRMMLIENKGVNAAGEVERTLWPITLQPGFATEGPWRGASNAFNAVFADLNADGRPDLLTNVLEFTQPDAQRWQQAGLGWLEQPATLSEPWTYHRIGHQLPDWVIGIGVADIDSDGDLDAVTGGYSGLNILRGGYSGASRDFDDPSVTPSATVARLAWFENPGKPQAGWQRHDISRRVRGMYDEFAVHDIDNDGDLDLIATRGNSGSYDGVFWLEQRRSRSPQPAFTAARAEDSRQLPLPPSDWRDNYGQAVEYVAPNKAAQEALLRERSSDALPQHGDDPQSPSH